MRYACTSRSRRLSWSLAIVAMVSVAALPAAATAETLGPEHQEAAQAPALAAPAAVAEAPSPEIGAGEVVQTLNVGAPGWIAPEASSSPATGGALSTLGGTGLIPDECAGLSGNELCDCMCTGSADPTCWVKNC